MDMGSGRHQPLFFLSHYPVVKGTRESDAPGIASIRIWVYLIGGGNTMISLQALPQIVTAIGGLGTAAFGLVDASKAAWGGVNHIGFSQIQKTVKSLTPGTPNNALSQDKIVATLKAHWFNGTAWPAKKQSPNP